MPPPSRTVWLLAFPFVTVRPEIVTVRPEPIWKTRLVALPFTARFAAPGPEMVMLVLTSSSPLVSPIVPVTAKLMVSPSLASASAWRNEPGPLSFVFVTVMVAAEAEITAAPTSAKHMGTPTQEKLGRVVRFFFIGISHGRGAGVGRGEPVGVGG